MNLPDLPFEGYVDEHRDLLDELHWGKDHKTEVADEIIDQRRWATTYRSVYRLPDGQYVELTEDRPSTEMQEGGDFSFELYEVEPVQVTAVKYRRVRV